MPPIAVSVAVVDRLLGPRLVPVGVPAPACSSPSATNSPGYPTSATIAESDFDNCLPIRISPGYCHHSPVGFGGMGDRRVAGGTEATN